MVDRDVSYIVVALASEDIAVKYKVGKKKFGLWFDESGKDFKDIILLNSPHITLKYPFFIDPKNEKALTEALGKIEFNSFSLDVHTSEMFHPKKYGNVLVARPTPSWELQRLHENIYKSVSPLGVDRDRVTFEQDRFTPHLTFLYGVENESVSLAEDYFKEEILPFKLDVSEFYLMRTLDKSKKIRTIVSTYKAV